MDSINYYYNQAMPSLVISNQQTSSWNLHDVSISLLESTLHRSNNEQTLNKLSIDRFIKIFYSIQKIKFLLERSTYTGVTIFDMKI
jgi:hypothetical protein